LRGRHEMSTVFCTVKDRSGTVYTVLVLYGGTKYSTVHTVLYRGKCHSTIKYWMWTAGTAGPGRVCRAVSLRE